VNHPSGNKEFYAAGTSRIKVKLKERKVTGHFSATSSSRAEGRERGQN